jgi:hypothetical protein
MKCPSKDQNSFYFLSKEDFGKLFNKCLIDKIVLPNQIAQKFDKIFSFLLILVKARNKLLGNVKRRLWQDENIKIVFDQFDCSFHVKMFYNHRSFSFSDVENFSNLGRFWGFGVNFGFEEREHFE